MIDSNIRISAVGDIMLGDFPLTLGWGVKSMFKNYKYYDPFIFTKNYLQLNDICFGNLESVLSTIGDCPEDLLLTQKRVLPQSVHSLKNAGFTVLNVANNHMMQHGSKAFIETIKYLLQSKISVTGVSDSSGYSIPTYFYVKNKVICLLGFSLRPEKYAKYTLYASSKPKSIFKQIRSNKSKCDILILSLHWGDEFVTLPSNEQIDLAQNFIEAGANIILGHHPHVLQPIQLYQGGLIAYSLGNFVFDLKSKMCRQSIILNFEMDAELNIINYHATPIWIDKYYRPVVSKNSDFANLFFDETKIFPRNRSYYTVVKRKEMLNQLYNRIFFVTHLHRYKNWVIKQNFKRFIQDRFKP